MQKIIRIIAGLLVGGLFIALIVSSAVSSNENARKAWNDNMTLGDRETAENVFYDYTDIMCPYCDKFANAVAAHFDEFTEDYIKDKKVYFELRLTDMLYVSHKDEGESAQNSRNAGLAAYCAADQNIFWEYYHGILHKLYEDYHSKGIGVDRNSEAIPKLEEEYFIAVGKHIDGLEYDRFADCTKNADKANELDRNTQKAMSITPGGVPYFVFNKYTANGFQGKWDAENYDWEQAKLLLDAGLAEK